MNVLWYLLIPSDNQRRWPDLSYFTFERFLGSLNGEMFWDEWLEIIWIWGEFPLLLLPYPLSTVNCLGSSWSRCLFLLTERKAISWIFEELRKICLQSKASFAKLTNDGFCFPSSWGSREWAVLYLSACMAISSFLPCRSLCVLCKKSFGPVQWPPLCQTQFWKPLCVLISLNKWKVKYLKAGQLWAVPKHHCWLFVFLDFNKGALARRPLHSCPYNPQIIKIHNKNKTEARLKVILPKQDFFLL